MKEKKVLAEMAHHIHYIIGSFLEPFFGAEQEKPNFTVKIDMSTPQGAYDWAFLLLSATMALNIYEKTGVNIFTYASINQVKDNAEDILKDCQFVLDTYEKGKQATLAQ